MKSDLAGERLQPLGHFSEFFFNDARKQRHHRDFTFSPRGARE